MKLVDISRTKRKEYVKAKVDELETSSKIKHMRDLYRGISDFKKVYQPRTNRVKNGNGDLGTRWHSGWGTALQTGRSRDRFPIVSLEFFIDIILLAALWPWGRLSL
jgi:hypothetical protein